MTIEEFELKTKTLFIIYGLDSSAKDWFVVKVRSLYRKKQVTIIMLDFIGSKVRFDTTQETYAEAFKLILGFVEERFIGWFNEKGWELPEAKEVT